MSDDRDPSAGGPDDALPSVEAVTRLDPFLEDLAGDRRPAAQDLSDQELADRLMAAQLRLAREGVETPAAAFLDRLEETVSHAVARRRGTAQRPRLTRSGFLRKAATLAGGVGLGAAAVEGANVALAPQRPSTLVIFSHVPLLAIYPKWGWGTQDSMQVLAQVKRFSSVTALNGHIHQIISKTEGNITMHTAASTAYPLHAPGNVAPTPLVLPAGTLPSRIGIRTVQFVQGTSSLALKDESLAASM